MPWSTPATWVAGAVLTAAQLNAQLRDNLNAAFPLGAPDVAWTGWTPTITQSGAVTKTVTYGKYFRVGRLIVASAKLDVTGTGTAANAVTIGALPVTAAFGTLLEVGSGYLFDASANFVYKATCELNSTTTMQFRPTNATTAGVLGADQFTAALAAADLISFTITYEAAS